MKVKKILFLLISFVFTTTLISCFQSEEAKAVDQMIMQISPVTLDSGDAIDAAEKAVETLLDTDRKQLKKEKQLRKHREKFDSLVKQKIVKDAQDLIEKIGDVTLDSGEVLEAVRKAIDTLDDSIKSEINNLFDLEEAEKKYSSLKIERFNNALNLIGIVNLDSGIQLKEAMSAYVELSSDERKSINNLNVLLSAREEYKRLKTIEKQKLATEYDRINNLTFYYSWSRPTYHSSRNYVSPYIVHSDSGNTDVLRNEWNYTSSEWLFIDNVKILVDGKTYYLDDLDFNSDNSRGRVWEYADYITSDKSFNILKEIANSSETIVRFNGSKYYSEFTVNQTDKNAIKSVLNAYDETGLDDLIFQLALMINDNSDEDKSTNKTQ